MREGISRLQPVLLFVIVAAGFLAWRWPGELVWDDTPVVCANRYSGATPQYRFEDPQFFRTVWEDAFGAVHIDGYRPLSWAMRRFGAACLEHDNRAAKGFLLLNSLLAGALAVSFYRLARRFTQTTAGALLALFLLLASTPLLTGFLVLFAGMQALVPLLMCSALNCYYAALETKRPAARLTLLALILFIGPWYREFVGLTSLLILLLEARRIRCRSWISLLAALGFLQALFPTAILHALCFPDLPVQPVYRLGVLADQVAVKLKPQTGSIAWLQSLLGSLKWRIVLDLLSILPPTFFLLAAFAWLWTAVRKRMPALAWRDVGVLGFFFLLTFLPFLKVFKEQVHLTYCLVPAAILLAASVESLWAGGLPQNKAGRIALASALLVPLADHALNPIVVRAATRHCRGAMLNVAEFCNGQMPPGSILFCNAHHAYDLQLLCEGRFTCYDTAMTGGNPSRLIDRPQLLEELLKDAGDTELYCLDVRLPDKKQQLGSDRAHWIVKQQAVDLQSFGEIQRVSYRYPVLDPFKMLLPMRNTSWPCSPDLEFDYYRGRAIQGPRWLREVAVNYYFYKITGRQVRHERLAARP